MNETSAFQLFIFSHLEVLFIFSFHSERALHIKKKSSIRSSSLSDFIKHCPVYCVAFSRVLRIMTQNESCDIRQLHVVELAVGSEQKLYYFCCDSNQDSLLSSLASPLLGLGCHRTSLTIKFNRVISPGISHVVCKTSWLKRLSR